LEMESLCGHNAYDGLPGGVHGLRVA